MIKTKLLASIPLGFLLGIVCFVLLYGNGKTRPQVGRTDLEWLLEKLHMPDYFPTEAESNKLALAFDRVHVAYASGQLNALRRETEGFPCFATNVAGTVYKAYLTQIGDDFTHDFLLGRQLRDFEDVADFSRYAETNIEMARFLGRMELRRGAGSGYLILLDRRVLRKLTQYRDRFRQEGKSGIEDRATRYIELWHGQIESAEGFTRNYMWNQVALQFWHARDGSKSAEQIVSYVRVMADGLVQAGYTPKWLDEFTVANVMKYIERKGR